MNVDRITERSLQRETDISCAFFRRFQARLRLLFGSPLTDPRKAKTSDKHGIEISHPKRGMERFISSFT